MQAAFGDPAQNASYRQSGVKAHTINLVSGVLGVSGASLASETRAVIDLMHPSKAKATMVPEQFASRFKTLKEKGIDELVISKATKKETSF